MTYPGESARAAKTTSGGHAYTEVAVTIGADSVLVAIPTVGARPALVLVGHGHNGSEQTINNPQFGPTLNAFIGDGWTLIASNAAGNGWGNDASIGASVAAWQWARTNLGTASTVLYGQSMGANVLANVAARGLISDPIAFVSIDGALNLAAAHASGSYQAAIRTAYGIASDGSNYAAKTAGHDPVLIDPEWFSGWRVLLSASPNDTSITKTQHSDVFATHLGAYPAVLTRLTGSGTHVAPENYFPADTLAFAQAALTVAEQVRAWTGTRWVPAPVMRWTGAVWAPAPVTVYGP